MTNTHENIQFSACRPRTPVRGLGRSGTSVINAEPAPRTSLHSYLEVPAGIPEDQDRLTARARQAVAVQEKILTRGKKSR